MYFLYIAALTIRVLINFLFIGSEEFFFSKEQTILGNQNATAIMPFLHTNPAMMTLASTITDLLIIAVGLIIGRNARVLRYYYQQKNEKMA